MSTLLFSGHMIDRPGRVPARFPPEKEAGVKAVLLQELQRVRNEMTGPLCAVSGAACGGDILFLECCGQLGIDARICLALPPDEFEAASVAFAGDDWIRRYRRLLQTLPVEILPEEERGVNVWAAANYWMYRQATRGPALLLALWDGKMGDGDGGTDAMVALARKNALPCIVIDPTLL